HCDTHACNRRQTSVSILLSCFFFFQAEDGIRDSSVTGVQTCALPISHLLACRSRARRGLRANGTRGGERAARRDGGAERPWRGRRVRRLPLPRPACRLAAAKNARGGERRRCDRRVASGLCRCDADVRRDRIAAPQEGPAVTRLTMAQALVRFLASQYVERDGVEQRFFAGVWGIFGHGN